MNIQQQPQPGQKESHAPDEKKHLGNEPAPEKQAKPGEVNKPGQGNR
ncbi:hypothetical protein [Stenotrophomonas acidaminiphila]|jgi:hypothetical protein|nr:hypothetical protein [Stenotrophomonas acidaminiphila]WHL17620.1 hypothetical protein QLF99_11115 [Stenotrophomonas acidaminiphila]